MQWNDIHEIAIALTDHYPDVDARYVRFTDLRQWVCELEGFQGDPQHSGEKLLEAIQAAWIDEQD